MFRLTQNQQGEVYIFAEALLWSFFPILTLLSYQSLPPLFSAAFTTLIATVFFAALLTFQGRWAEVARRHAWRDIFFVTLFIGVLFYGFVFLGIQRTTAGNASLLLLMEVFFSFFILGLWKKEVFSGPHLLGAGLMVIGAALVLFQNHLEINWGNIFILIGTAMAPFGNYFSQKARHHVSSITIMFLRSFFSAFFLFFIAFLTEPVPARDDLFSSLSLLLLNGVLLFGISKILWIEGIHRISITKATALAAGKPIFTLIFAYFLLREIPTWWQVIGVMPVLAGVWLLTDFKSSRNSPGSH